MATNMDKVMIDIESRKDEWLEVINSTREMILANLLMLTQIPAQTFHEKNRAEFILSRFTEAGVPEPKTDVLHNAIGIYTARPHAKTVLICANMDNQFDLSTDQNITITEDKVRGAGVADDNIALAILMTLPDIIKRLNLNLNINLILLASTRFHGRGDFGGIKHFVKNYPYKIDAAIDLSGINLGKINYFTLSRVRCDINCETFDIRDTSWQRISDGNAILVLNEIIDALMRIPLPKKPRTALNIGMIQGGERYSTPSHEGSIHLEALSEGNSIMENLIEEIQNRCIDVGAKHGAMVSTSFFGRNKASNITSGHPLIKAALYSIKSIGYEPRMEYTNSQISVTLAEEIPSVNLGLTTGRGGSTQKSYIDIPPISEGVLQLVMLLSTLDKEEDDE